jgi:hypothetical protein
MTKTMMYHGREWLFVAEYLDCCRTYEEWYCPMTGEAMQIWDDGYIEIFEYC